MEVDTGVLDDGVAGGIEMDGAYGVRAIDRVV
jgi:hypothetical protein